MGIGAVSGLVQQGVWGWRCVIGLFSISLELMLNLPEVLIKRLWFSSLKTAFVTEQLYQNLMHYGCSLTAFDVTDVLGARAGRLWKHYEGGSF